MAVDQSNERCWGWVSLGLRLKLAALGLLAVLLSGIAGTTVVAPRTLAAPDVATMIAIAFLVALVLDFVGRCMCVAVPLTQPARTFLASSIGFQLAAVILLFTPWLAIPELTLPLQILVGLALAACGQAFAAMLFMLYARYLAIALERTDLSKSPLQVLGLIGVAGTSFTTGGAALAILVFLVMLCPCLWWLGYVGLVVLEQGWRNSGFPEALFWPAVRLAPTLVVALLCYSPLYRYGRLLWNLIGVIDLRRRAALG